MYLSIIDIYHGTYVTRRDKIKSFFSEEKIDIAWLGSALWYPFHQISQKALLPQLHLPGWLFWCLYKIFHSHFFSIPDLLELLQTSPVLPEPARFHFVSTSFSHPTNKLRFSRLLKMCPFLIIIFSPSFCLNQCHLFCINNLPLI